MQRGFKRLAEDIAEEMRTELGLERHEPLDPFRLAERLLIPTAPFVSLREHGMSTKSIAALSAPGSPISAFTAFCGSHKAIYYNPGHSSRRTANSIAHELAHVILEHEPLSATTAASRTWNDLQEAEADWLGGVLLVPRCAALRWLELGGDIIDGADHYGVSVDLFAGASTTPASPANSSSARLARASSGARPRPIAMNSAPPGAGRPSPALVANPNALLSRICGAPRAQTMSLHRQPRAGSTMRLPSRDAGLPRDRAA